MSDASAGIALRVQELGANGVRARLREINDELRAGQPVTKELRQEVRELGVQVNTQNRVVRLSSQAWLENHRTLQSAGRIMSTVGSIARSALAVTTAWSLASLAFGKTNSQLMETRQELERTTAQLQDAMARGADPEEISKLQEKVNVLTVSVKELESQDLQGTITNFVNLGATVAIMGSSSITAAAKFAPLIKGLISSIPHSVAYSGALANMSRGTLGLSLRTSNLIGNIGKIAGATAGAGIAIGGLTGQMDNLYTAITGQKVNKEQANLLNYGATVGGGALLGGSVGGPIGALAGGTIGAIIGLIQQLQELDKVVGGGSYDAFKKNVEKSSMSASKTSSGHKTVRTRLYASGGVISEPIVGMGKSGQTYMFGERGKEVVTPMGQSGSQSSSSGGNVYITVHGDVSGEELIYKVRMAIKDNLRGLGFTGLG